MTNLKMTKIEPCVTTELDSLETALQLKRAAIAEIVIKRHFVGRNNISSESMEREALMRMINPGADFELHLKEAQKLAEGGFGAELLNPSVDVENSFRKYAQTELGAAALERLLALDSEHINKGWRTKDGEITKQGILAYGAGLWRPFRVASNGVGSDAVTPSGALVLPDEFDDEYYSTGDIANPLAIIHHELMAHVLPLKEAEYLEPGREMELICIRFESDMLRELGLRERKLNWGKDDGTIDHTLHEPSERYYQGLVIDEGGSLVQIDPATHEVLGPARIKSHSAI